MRLNRDSFLFPQYRFAVNLHQAQVPVHLQGHRASAEPRKCVLAVLGVSSLCTLKSVRSCLRFTASQWKLTVAKGTNFILLL